MAASAPGSARIPVVILGILCLLGGAAVAWVVETVAPAHARAPKTVEVVVAAKDLSLGTAFTKDNIDVLTTTQHIPKDALPKDAVVSKNDLIDKRIYRAAHQGELFSTRDVKGVAHVSLNGGMDILHQPFPKMQTTHVGPGCRVDLIAVFNDADRHEVFTLLPDLHVLEVNPPSNAARSQDVLTFPVDEKQHKLVTQANTVNCKLELVLRHPDAPKREFDYDQTEARIKSLVKLPTPKVAPKPKPEMIVAPAPRLKQVISIPKPFWGGVVTAGNHVDILAVHGEGKKREVFTLLPDMQIFAVVEQHDPAAKSGFLDVTNVSFAMSDKQALLIALATEHDCYLELVLRHPNAPKRDFSYEQTLARVNGFAKKPEPKPEPKPATPALPVAPQPRRK